MCASLLQAVTQRCLMGPHDVIAALVGRCPYLPVGHQAILSIGNTRVIGHFFLAANSVFPLRAVAAPEWPVIAKGESGLLCTVVSATHPRARPAVRLCSCVWVSRECRGLLFEGKKV